MSAQAEYWREAVELAFDGCGLWDAIKDIPSDKMREIGASLATSAECQGQAFYNPENPLKRQNDVLQRKLKWERELESCPDCGGSGRLIYSAGPWAVNSSCSKCDCSGKIHPRGEGEPS